MAKRMRFILSAIMVIVAMTAKAQVTTSSLSGKVTDLSLIHIFQTKSLRTIPFPRIIELTPINKRAFIMHRYYTVETLSLIHISCATGSTSVLPYRRSAR